MIRVETDSSIYFFDEGGRYCRMPRTEVERSPLEKKEQLRSGGPMDDNVWNQLATVRLCRHRLATETDNESLNILYPGAVIGIITSPILDGFVDAAKEIVQHYQDFYGESCEESG